MQMYRFEESSEKNKIRLASSEIRGYLKAAKLLEVLVMSDLDTIRAYIQILSFGVEKSLKALIRHVDKNTPPRHHKLDKLYDALGESTRSELLMMAGKPRHILAALSSNKNSFEAYRYLEEARDKTDFFGPEIMTEIMDFAHFRLEIEMKRQAEVS
jgi:hypothetical protein